MTMAGFRHAPNTNQQLKRMETQDNTIRFPLDPDLVFHSNGVLTLGIEIELQIINRKDMNLASKAIEILEAATQIPSLARKLKPELFLSTIEINSDICSNVHQAEIELKASFEQLNNLGEQFNLTFATTGNHPFADYYQRDIYPSSRYQQMLVQHQWLTRRMAVNGMHIHIGMANEIDCIAYNNFFSHLLPHLLALSSSSPFWQGADTGLASCRPTVYEAHPTAGHPYPLATWADFINLYGSLKQSNSIHSLKDLWWDIRPCPHYGTLELRICDSVASLEETLAIVAFAHALAHWFYEHQQDDKIYNYLPDWLNRENKWRVIRHGLAAELIIDEHGQCRPIIEDIYAWLDKLTPNFLKLGYSKYHETILQICRLGSSSSRQRKIFEASQSLEAVVQHNINEYLLGKPIW